MQRTFRYWLAASVALACAIGGVLLIVFRPSQPPAANLVTASDEATSTAGEKKAATSQPPAAEPQTAESNVIDDDGRTMWVSPTSGPPLDLSFFPPGCQLVIALRPAALAAHPEFDKVVDSLGPTELHGAQFPDGLFHNPHGIASVLIGCQVADNSKWQVAIVAHLTDRLAAEHVAAELPNAVKTEYGGQAYLVTGEWAYFLPSDTDATLIVVSSPEAIREIIDLGGDPPPLRRDVERLLADTDRERTVTLVVAPNFLFSEGQGIFRGEFAALRGPLFWFLGDELGAAALSLNWGDDFFIEFRAVPTLDVPPAEVARQLADRVQQLPALVEDFVLHLDPQPYGRRVITRLPEMVRRLVSYTRSGVEGDCVVLRSYLPVTAGHNLAIAAELALAEGRNVRGNLTLPATARNPSSPEADSPEAIEPSVSERLRRPTSLRVVRDSLEAVIEQLAQDIGVEMIIVGADLQADGITRNQQLAIDVENRPAEEILVEVLRRANPDKSPPGPDDPRQKLVYVVKPKDEGRREAVFITTRSRAAERGDALPAAFQP